MQQNRHISCALFLWTSDVNQHCLYFSWLIPEIKCLHFPQGAWAHWECEWTGAQHHPEHQNSLIQSRRYRQSQASAMTAEVTGQLLCWYKSMQQCWSRRRCPHGHRTSAVSAQKADPGGNEEEQRVGRDGKCQTNRKGEEDQEVASSYLAQDSQETGKRMLLQKT